METKEAHGEPAWLDAGYAGMERMITSLVIMLPMTVYGFYTVISEHLVTGWNWLWAFLYLVVPLFGLQRYIIHSIGMDYRIFIGNALRRLSGK